MQELFERVYAINLDSRPDRWEQFQKRLPEDWPFLPPQRFRGIEGKLVSSPLWWKGGPGSWGCHRTHTRIYEDCLNDGINSVLICEDDAVFTENFSEKAKVFVQHLPDDWSIIYLGGQHIQQNERLPRKINDWVYQPYNVNRNHCLGLRGRKTIELYFRHLTNYPDWQLPHHTDHRLGALHKTAPRGLYCPKEWLVGQGDGFSDICCQKLDLRLFTGAEELIYPKINRNGIAIMGGYGGGTSLIAGLLYHLGINLGIKAPKETDKICCKYENDYLGHICRSSYTEPWLSEDIPYVDRVNHLRHWAGQRCKENEKPLCFGGKHAILSLMGQELLEAWNDPYFICVDRSPDECYETMNQAGWGWHPRAIKYAIDHLFSARDEFLREYSPRFLRLSFKRTLLSPSNSIQEVCDFLEHEPTPEQWNNTLAYIKDKSNEEIYL